MAIVNCSIDRIVQARYNPWHRYPFFLIGMLSGLLLGTLPVSRVAVATERDTVLSKLTQDAALSENEWLAQTVIDPPLEEPQPEPPLPEPEPIPEPDDVLTIPAPIETLVPLPDDEVPESFVVTEFSFVGNTAFRDEELQAIVADFRDRPITLNDLFVARALITQTYLDAGYINSGAYLPIQRIEEGIVEIRVIEGRLEEINIEGLRRLQPEYVRKRIAARTGQPLNVNDIIESLQLLQLNPLIQEISSQLSPGTMTGGSVLNVTAVEADAVSGQAILDNSRSPLVGSFRRRFVFSHNNLSGHGDPFSVGYSNTDGSNSWDVRYAFPFNAYDGTIEFFYSGSRSEIIEPDLKFLGVESNSDELEFGIRQPIVQTPRQEVALGLSLSHQWADSSFRLDGFPRLPLVTAGSDADGNTRQTAIRFTQEWILREVNQVAAVRSQFSLGTTWFGASDNPGDLPDSNFFSWQGQAQYVRIFEDDISLFLRLNAQFANSPLLTTEQFRLGGQGSIRGYQQDQFTTDNGIFASAEARFPLMTIPEIDSTFQVAPFIDYGVGWNEDGNDSEALLSIGAGILWQVGNRFNARLDYGIPLSGSEPSGDSWQEHGILFTLTGELF
ncbi:ShlB/FhaC/HecB family hemolysin secretion/activation protein [Oscillatoria sp. CS-180]|uniref:ShlB/FhaC/HecB family hemolysin secretion/activation protein n=1 Tax=Oscillatoria sp. CS-180 TaxID=3021720 RepID=UPI00233151D0|nr:ShlB/FhaC/HecB family hemolysin secretion/activation protein [Oscillatoria sp. CS-180]MDB9528839.1 ShlB/FhaC/HecB family hemolysin secretion/activation protein [Oscillatoria sp. CS-180]